MKICAERKKLAEAVAWVSQAIPRQPYRPALAGLRLRAEGSTLTISAFDYDVSHEARLTVEVAAEGECLVSAAFLRTLVAALSGAQITLTLDDGQLSIASGSSKYRAQLLDMKDYPSLPETPPVVGSVPAEELAQAVTVAAPPVDDASPTEQVRGMRWEADETGLHVVGLSSAQVIHRTLEWSGTPFEVTTPSKALLAATAGLTGSVAISHSESALGLSDGERTVVIRTLAVKFARWQVVPRPADQDRFASIVDRDDLIEAVKRAGLLTRDAKDGGKVSLVLDRDSIEVTASDESAGGSEVLSAEADGAESITFNPALLLPALAAMPTGQVRLGIGVRKIPDRAAFMTIRPADESGIAEAVVAARTGGEAR